jgi:protein-S-isoprenylcysteine O-methyltransferase Ste14
VSPVVERPWFVKKRIGWGLSPGSWQGWTATFVYLALLVVVALWASRSPQTSIVGFIVLTSAFLVLAFATGERPGRRRPSGD